MKTIAVYDPPMCCSTGVCGPEADPDLARLAALLSDATKRGVLVERYNLAHEPMKFLAHPEVKPLLDAEDGLPAIFVDGKLVLNGRLPSADELNAWTAA